MTSKYAADSWWTSDLSLAPSQIHGQGVFTSKAIAAGTVVIRWGGNLFTGAELGSGAARAHTFVGIGIDLYLANPADKAPSLDDFMNHSCDGNVWMADEVTLVTKRSILANEELTADYALWLNDPAYRMKQPCNCRAPVCRHSISGVDWKLPDVQQRYAGHFSPFINRLILEQQRT